MDESFTEAKEILDRYVALFERWFNKVKTCDGGEQVETYALFGTDPVTLAHYAGVSLLNRAAMGSEDYRKLQGQGAHEVPPRKMDRVLVWRRKPVWDTYNDFYKCEKLYMVTWRIKDERRGVVNEQRGKAETG